MNIVELQKDNTTYCAKVIIPAHEISEAINTEVTKMAKTAKMDGFRVGKVPVALLKKKYAISIREDLVNQKIVTATKNIIKDQKLNTIFEPTVTELKNVDGENLEFVLKFDVIPELILPNFKNIKLQRPRIEVSDTEIDASMDQLVAASKKYDKEITTGANQGDQITIDAIGYVNDQAFAGGQLKAHKLVLGSGAFIPGFEEQLIGSKPEDDVLVKVTFPADYHANDLAGKEATFQVKVLSVHQATVPVLDETFAQKFKCEDILQLKTMIKQRLIGHYEHPTLMFMKIKLFDQLEQLLDFDVPATLLAQEKQSIQQQEAQLAEDVRTHNMSTDELTQYLDKLALRRVRIGLMLAEYIKQKNIVITEQDLQQAIIAQMNDYPGQEQEIIDYYQRNKAAVDHLRNTTLEEKAVKEIFAQEVELIDQLCSKEEIEQLLAF